MLTITLLSIVIAAASGYIAWRSIRREHLRSDARVASLAEARPFYLDFLGFVGDWGDEDGSTYAQISRSGVQLHLNAQSRLSGNSGMLVRMDGIDALHAELSARQGQFAPSPISFTPWDSRVFHVIDPFGNAIQFWENNPPGVAKPPERLERS